MKKMVLFGAGKIGRSFIAQLFSAGGYEIVFVDIDHTMVDMLNNRKKYQIIIKDVNEETIEVNNVRAIHLSESGRIINELLDANIAATSVGKNGVDAIMPMLAEAISKRKTKNKGPLDIIIAENMRNADEYFSTSLQKYLPDDFPVNDFAGLIETSIGKMVPIMPKEDLIDDPLKVFAEAYNTLILAKKAFKNCIPDVPGLAAKENMKAWVDRKLFIHNFGHAAVAYLGYEENPKYRYIWEPLENQSFLETINRTMRQSGEILRAVYPNEFSEMDINDHIHDLIRRFRNRALGDTIFRVGCDLQRKLGPEDRLITPLKAGLSFKMPTDQIQDVIHAAFLFRAKDEHENLFPQDQDFIDMLNKYGKQWVLKEVCKLNESDLK